MSITWHLERFYWHFPLLSNGFDKLTFCYRLAESCPPLNVGRIMPIINIWYIDTYKSNDACKTPVRIFNFPYFWVGITIMILRKYYFPALIRVNFTYKHQFLAYRKMRKTLKMTDTSKKIFVNCYFHKIVEYDFLDNLKAVCISWGCCTLFSIFKKTSFFRV